MDSKIEKKGLDYQEINQIIELICKRANSEQLKTIEELAHTNKLLRDNESKLARLRKESLLSKL